MQEGDPAGMWEETFKSHTDSKPKGPEAISLDLGFPGAQHVYGLPQHASTLSLVSTTGIPLHKEGLPITGLNLPQKPPCCLGAFRLLSSFRPTGSEELITSQFGVLSQHVSPELCP